MLKPSFAIFIAVAKVIHLKHMIFAHTLSLFDLVTKVYALPGRLSSLSRDHLSEGGNPLRTNPSAASAFLNPNVETIPVRARDNRTLFVVDGRIQQPNRAGQVRGEGNIGHGIKIRNTGLSSVLHVNS